VPAPTQTLREQLREWTYELGGPGTRERLEKLTPPRNEYGVDPYGFDIARALVERWVPKLPFVAPFYARIGQVVGTPENCRRLLAAEEALLVFPEGVRGLNKTFDARYKLRTFSTGFMRLALEAGAPIVPIGVVGAEEQAPSLVDLKPLARLLGLPALPITPYLLPLPLPVHYHIHFGAPLRFTGSPDADDAELERQAGEVQAAVQALLDRGLAERPGVFL
jgi:1-acyl-sn-glycerol-3-phosphate acyltransferase